MRQKLTSLLVIWLLLALTPPPAAAQDFGPVFRALEQLKREDADKIRVEVAGGNFSARVNEGGPAPRLLGTFPLSQWPAFVAEAAKHGLREYRQRGNVYYQSVELTFLRPQDTRLSTGRQELNVTGRFFDYMRTAPEFPARTGKNGFAILIYDPHSSVPGRYLLVPALDELLRSNPALKFKFLVEGEYERPDRSIPFNGLDGEILKLPAVSAGRDPRRTLVYALLQRFMIDCAMAYRLIYGDVPSRAIDDNPGLAAGVAAEDQLRQGLTEPDDTYDLNIYRILAKADEALAASAEVSAEQRAARDELFRTADEYWATTSHALYGSASRPTRDVVSDYQKASQLFTRLVELAERFQQAVPAARLREEIAPLKGKDPFKFKKQRYQPYAARDVVMGEQIIGEADFTSGYTPIVFLGFSHLYAITADLGQKEIGYAVFTPRRIDPLRSRDDDDFNDFISPATRAEYLRKAARWNKGPVGPLASQVQTVLGPFIQQGGTKFQSEWAADRAAFLGQTGFTVDYEKLAAAASANGVLTQARIGWEGGAPPPKPPPGSFAYFEPGPEGSRPRLVVLNPREAGWGGAGGQARYNFLRDLPLTYPDAFELQSNALNLYPDPGTGRTFAAVFEPVSGRHYFSEGGADATADFLRQHPLGSLGGGVTIRIDFSETERRQERKFSADGE